MALLGGEYKCSKQNFLYVHYETPDCSMEIRCYKERGINCGNNATLCLVRYFDVEKIHQKCSTNCFFNYEFYPHGLHEYFFIPFQ